MKAIQTELKGNVNIVRINGDMEFDDSNEFDACINNILRKKTIPPYIIINLDKCNYIDTGCLVSIWNAYKQTQQMEGELMLCNLSEMCQEIIDMTTASKHLRVFKNSEECLTLITR